MSYFGAYYEGFEAYLVRVVQQSGDMRSSIA